MVPTEVGNWLCLIDGTRVPSEFAVECRWITLQVAIGGMVGTRHNALDLVARGVTHVVNLQAEWDDRVVFEGLAIRLAWVPIADALATVAPASLVAAVEFSCDALRDSDSRLFIHCMSGRSRSAIVAYAVLRARGMKQAECLQRIGGAQPSAHLPTERLGVVETILATHGWPPPCDRR